MFESTSFIMSESLFIIWWCAEVIHTVALPLFLTPAVCPKCCWGKFLPLNGSIFTLTLHFSLFFKDLIDWITFILILEPPRFYLLGSAEAQKRFFLHQIGGVLDHLCERRCLQSCLSYKWKYVVSWAPSDSFMHTGQWAWKFPKAHRDIRIMSVRGSNTVLDWVCLKEVKKLM